MSGNNNHNNVAGALTYPGRSEETQEPQPVPVQPRAPRNLQGLLRFAVEAGKTEDGQSNPEFHPLDDEDKNFLEEAMKVLTVNIGDVLSKSIRVLGNSDRIHSVQLGETLPDDIHTAFNNLLEVLDDIDYANDFYRLGGFAIFPVCLGSENEQVRLLANAILAQVCQNNPYCQERAFESGLLNVVLNLVHTERRLALSKCLSAVSCISRGYDPACREFLAQDGCRTLVGLLHTDELMVRSKAAFFMRYLCDVYPETKKIFLQLNIINMSVDFIKAGRDNSSEHFLQILLILVSDGNPVAMAQCRDPNLNLKAIVQKHLDFCELSHNMYTEEKKTCRELLSKVFENYIPIEFAEEVADR